MRAFEMHSGGFRFPKASRVRKRADFLAIQRHGRRLHSGHFVVAYKVGTGRLGITVSKKVGNAVVRNRVKRCLREFARQCQWPPKKLDVVVIAKPEARMLSGLNHVSSDFQKIVQRLENRC